MDRQDDDHHAQRHQHVLREREMISRFCDECRVQEVKHIPYQYKTDDVLYDSQYFLVVHVLSPLILHVLFSIRQRHDVRIKQFYDQQRNEDDELQLREGCFVSDEDPGTEFDQEAQQDDLKDPAVSQVDRSQDQSDHKGVSRFQTGGKKILADEVRDVGQDIEQAREDHASEDVVVVSLEIPDEDASAQHFVEDRDRDGCDGGPDQPVHFSDRISCIKIVVDVPCDKQQCRNGDQDASFRFLSQEGLDEYQHQQQSDSDHSHQEGQYRRKVQEEFSGIVRPYRKSERQKRQDDLKNVRMILTKFIHNKPPRSILYIISVIKSSEMNSELFYVKRI